MCVLLWGTWLRCISCRSTSRSLVRGWDRRRLGVERERGLYTSCGWLIHTCAIRSFSPPLSETQRGERGDNDVIASGSGRMAVSPDGTSPAGSVIPDWTIGDEPYSSAVDGAMDRCTTRLTGGSDT